MENQNGGSSLLLFSLLDRGIRTRGWSLESLGKEERLTVARASLGAEKRKHNGRRMSSQQETGLAILAPLFSILFSQKKVLLLI